MKYHFLCLIVILQAFGFHCPRNLLLNCGLGVLSQRFKLNKQLWPHHQASLWFFCSSRLPATPGITSAPSSSGSLTDGPASIQHPLHRQGWQIAETRNVRLTELIIRVKAQEHLSMRLCSSRALGSSQQRCPGRATQTHPALLFPTSQLLTWLISTSAKWCLCCSLSSLSLQGSARNWISSTSPGSEGQNPKTKLFALSRSFFTAWMVSEVLAVNASTFHSALFPALTALKLLFPSCEKVHKHQKSLVLV